MAEAAAGRRSSPTPPARQANGVGGVHDVIGEDMTATATPNRLAAPTDSVRGGGRRSPTTGHVRRRRSDLGAPGDSKGAMKGPSPPREQQTRSGFDRISTSEDDDEYWHAYFAVQSKNIAAHNGSSIAAAAAGVLRPGPPRQAGAGGSTISRKSTTEKGRGLGDRRPSAPDFLTVAKNDDADDQPPTPKPVLRRRVRSKSSGAPLEVSTFSPPSPSDSEDNRRTTTTASETSSAGSRSRSGQQGKRSAKPSGGDKALLWKKWTQAAPPPSKKEVLSIDPAEVLRGLHIPEPEVSRESRPEAEEVRDSAPEEAERKSPQREEAPVPTHAADDDGDVKLRRSRNASLRSEKGGGRRELARKSSLRPRDEKPLKRPPQRASWWGRLFGRREAKQADQQEKQEKQPVRLNWLLALRTLRDLRAEWRCFLEAHPAELRRLRAMGGRCLTSLLLVLLYCGLGGFLFRFIEGAFESFYKCGVKRVKRDFIDLLWTSSHNLREDEWKSRARRKLWEFEEQLHAAHEAGVTSYSGIRSWSFLNAVVYCLTVVTTIGYGHISPSTNTGRAVTIIYAIFGIPMFLILLADFGKLFTRGIKFVWSFVRRLYYTGSCRKVRRTQGVQSAVEIFGIEIMKGAQMVYDLATFRRPSMLPPEERPGPEDPEDPVTASPLRHSPCEPPATPAPSAFEVDDEFNLPISVAIFILLLYIFLGASIYNLWEGWGFFEAFYFVFVSMSTIGFGDFVPKHPMYMMASIVYLVFGLALTSMCINVVQEKLSDSFRQASAKIGATIGLRMAEEEASTNPETPATGPAADGDQEHPEHCQFLSPNDAREVR